MQHSPKTVTLLRESFYIPSLDGIRALSFLLVFFSHAGGENIFPGGFGVTIFFFLSGYLITTRLRREYAAHSTIQVRAFFIHRAFRIFPLLYLTIAVGYFLQQGGLLDEGRILPLGLFALLTHWTNYYLIYVNHPPFSNSLTPLWSISVEEHFYLFFPFLFLLLRRYFPTPRKTTLLIVGCCLSVLLRRLYLAEIGHFNFWPLTILTDCRIDTLLWGCLLALVANPMLPTQDQPRFLQRPWLIALFPLSLVALGYCFLNRNMFFRDVFRQSIQSILLLPLFYTVIRYSSAPGIRLLNTPLIRHIGRLSYASYLSHVIILTLLKNALNLGLVPHAILSLAVTLIVAEGCRRGVEQPILRLKQKLLFPAGAGEPV